MRLIFKHSNKIIFLVTVVMWLIPPLALAQTGTNVYLQPVETPEGLLKVDIVAENVADLYGAEVKLKYDPGTLAIQDADPDRDGLQIAEGDFLSAAQGFVVANQVDERAGTITYALTLLNPAPPVNGTGPIATITFERLQDSPSMIEIEKAKLVASTLQSIPNQTASLEIGSQTPMETTSMASSISLSPDSDETAPIINITRWLAVAGIVVLIVIGLGLLFLLGSVVIFGKRPTKPRQLPSIGKPGPHIWLRPVPNIRIQRPRLSSSRRAIQTRLHNK